MAEINAYADDSSTSFNENEYVQISYSIVPSIGTKTSREWFSNFNPGKRSDGYQKKHGGGSNSEGL